MKVLLILTLLYFPTPCVLIFEDTFEQVKNVGNIIVRWATDTGKKICDRKYLCRWYQEIWVEGAITCNGKPYFGPITVELSERDVGRYLWLPYAGYFQLDADDQLEDNDGKTYEIVPNFVLRGGQKETFPIQPYLNITHMCGVEDPEDYDLHNGTCWNVQYDLPLEKHFNTSLLLDKYGEIDDLRTFFKWPVVVNLDMAIHLASFKSLKRTTCSRILENWRREGLYGN
ncbi:hypothetical protein L596_028890 [Steinernema carpocapsae]|uniref:Uncharacterized protein n=1 Tax=Steinernema carpocapsae TaxID=34508 RepID=A0A4V5ZY90_STECR|nr:hypothetical protein L596_028890 [Steinernema carpocapsae]